MAFNNGFPMNYPQYYPQNPQTFPQQFQSPQIQQPQTQIQNGGFIPVPSEDVARNYPVAPGNSVTFKNENAPYVYTKTMGFSQLDRPIFEKYKLVREEDVEIPQESTSPKQYSDETIEKLKEQFKEDISKLWGEIDVLKEQISKPTTTKKKDNGGS